MNKSKISCSLPETIFLKECFDYRDGDLYWKSRPVTHFKTTIACKSWNTKYSGIIAGHIYKSHTSKTFYRSVRIDGKSYLAHRVIYAIIFGNCDEQMHVDHIDRNGLNNSVENLRLVTRSQNSFNRSGQSNNASGYTGVSWNSSLSRWFSQIGVNGKRVYLGSFKNITDAISARKKAELLFLSSESGA